VEVGEIRMIKKMAWLPVIALLLLLMLSTPALAGVALESYSDAARTTVCDDFTVLDDPVYMKATGILSGKDYEFRYYDAGDTLLLTDGPITADVNDEAVSEMTPSNYPSSTAGTWSCEIWSLAPSLKKDTDTFTVQQSAIPEFPTVLSAIAVATLCGVAYLWMRKRIGYAQA